MGELLGTAIPDFAGMLLRSRLVALFASQAPPLTVICAPAGYGKSVLAAQLARHGEFDVVNWIELPDLDASGELVLRQVADSLEGEATGGRGHVSEAARSLESVSLDDTFRVRSLLQRYSGSRMLLAIDGVNGLTTPAILESLAQDLGQYTSPGSRVLIACRRIEHGGELDPGIVWLIEEADLAFSISEIQDLIVGASGAYSELDARRIHAHYSGHPAITRIMMRHGAPASDVRPADLIWQTERIVGRFSESAIAALYLAAILREGHLELLQYCASSCDLAVDWSALHRGVPLLCITADGERTATFRVHAVLADVVARVSHERLHEDDLETIRAVAFERLSEIRDYMGLLSALEHYARESEVAAWCAQDGVLMIRHAGHALVARLLARLSPITIASSASLLLLRAHVQRASSSSTAALESASMAMRISEVEHDEESLVASVLLIARLNLDRGVPAESSGLLNGILQHPVLESNHPARYLADAYLAVTEGRCGRVMEASSRASALANVVGNLDQGSDEAVFIINAIGAVASECAGDWSVAATTLAGIAHRTDIAPLQRSHIRSNYATALAELGDVREAGRRVEAVVTECVELGIDCVLGYAAATWSDLLRVSGEPERGQELHDMAVRSLERMQDAHGLATQSLNAARALRALGQCEEALSLAKRSEVYLSDFPLAVDVVRLMAQIEIAASQLALGDVDAAEEGIVQVISVPLVQDAMGHLLRCDLVLAEIDRRKGAIGKAVNRLKRHKEYILTGSANMTLACYIRAFPGLLGLVGVSLGRALLPSRVLRLLPRELVGAGLDLAEQSLPPDKATILRQRYGAAGGDPAPAIDGAGPEAFCNLRMFGRLEVTTSFGAIPEKGWEKRKGRLMLLMLACHPGREMTRDAMVERLWSHMERERALRNLYVTWSGLRRVLACGNKDVRVDIFAGSNNDALWLTDLVKSDLDEFQAELRTLRSARIEGESEVVVATALRLSEIYRGDLLPIDIYEKWFEEERNRTRREFCDAMVTGAQAAFDIEQYDTAMAFLRRASDIDHLREDIYQLMMKCQMNSGQRSGAIDTYNTCRSRLVDDLGIDPCSETNRLFQAVLAMEDDGSTEPPGGESSD